MYLPRVSYYKHFTVRIRLDYPFATPAFTRRHQKTRNQFAYSNSIDTPNSPLPEPSSPTSPPTSPMYSVSRDSVELEFSNPSFSESPVTKDVDVHDSTMAAVSNRYLDLSSGIADETC